MCAAQKKKKKHLNMSAAGSVPVVPLPPHSCLNNLSVLLSGGGGAGGGGGCCCWLHMRPPWKRELQPFDFDYVECAERGRTHSRAAVFWHFFFFFSKTMLHALDVRVRCFLERRQLTGLSNFQGMWYFSLFSPPPAVLNNLHQAFCAVQWLGWITVSKPKLLPAMR